ncbi:MAG: hypothetical protein UH625_04325 [Muribaculaceae bacterium]|nr:hypothetical protein [Muribaculaceae bacterium]
MTGIIIQIVIGLILILALPHIISATVRKKGNRKGLAILSRIIGWLIIILAVWNLIESLI